MLVNTFEQMKLEDEIEKAIDSIVETGECTLFVGWETKIKHTRRALSLEEQLQNDSAKTFKVEEKLIYDNAKIKHIKCEDFVFDKYDKDNWDRCSKIYRTYSTIDELRSDKANNLLTEEKLETLKGVVAGKKNRNPDKAVEKTKLRFWNFGEIWNSKTDFAEKLACCSCGRREIIRFEPNPFVTNPFIHANIIESPRKQAVVFHR